MLGIIIQARMGSTRLPNKMTLPFYKNKGVLEIILLRIKNRFPDIKTVVATSTNVLDDQIIDICKKTNTLYFRGSEHNVMKRFIDCAEKHNTARIIRVCADNPFIDMDALDELIKHGESTGAEYLSYQTSNNTPSILTHYGLWAEYVTLSALKKASQLTQCKKDIEHVTNYIYMNEDKFRLSFLKIPYEIEKHNYIRMTLDTKEDFVLLKKIYIEFRDFTGPLVKFVERISNNEAWYSQMKSQIIKNEK